MAKSKYKKDTKADPRKLVIEVLLQLIEKGQSLNAVLPLAVVKLESKEQGLLQELVYGVSRWWIRLEAILDHLLSRPVKQKDLDVKLILLTGIYQLLYTRIPDHAAVSTSVELVNKVGKQWAKGLVNGVLRRVLRERDAIETAVDKNVCIETAHPDWLCMRIQADWQDNAKQVMSANNQRAPMSLRVNILKISRNDYCSLLKEKQLSFTLVDWSEVAIVLDKAIETAILPGYEEGLVSVQDLAAQYATQLLDVKAGMKVLDACAAPGGKTSHIYESCPDLQSLLALDNSELRLRTLQENLSRLSIDSEALQCKVADVADKATMSVYDSFDRILLDAPCSATGVIRRHPDIKMLRRASDIADLAKQQQKILENLWALLAPGGMLLYSTCSILHQENTDQIRQFIDRHDDAEIDQKALYPWESNNDLIQTGYQVMPGQLNMDGFYYAPLRRKKSTSV
ncbi:16S rRNA (cytosine(967)-C(5))-methyltransferase [hydrothermal vent metagenome]|uniref:16S rRNA (cytosine(967)-C(5))-methyltransferase n=1 Tax=hydrothermal vent metagenome TaxID=652676 RepID=A0A3B0Z082_9ZZZZ